MTQQGPVHVYLILCEVTASLQGFRSLHLFLEVDEEQAKGTHLYAVCDRSGKSTAVAVLSYLTRSSLCQGLLRLLSEPGGLSQHLRSLNLW